MDIFPNSSFVPYSTILWLSPTPCLLATYNHSISAPHINSRRKKGFMNQNLVVQVLYLNNVLLKLWMQRETLYRQTYLNTCNATNMKGMFHGCNHCNWSPHTVPSLGKKNGRNVKTSIPTPLQGTNNVDPECILQ